MSDVENGVRLRAGEQLNDIRVRNAFIRKVMGIVGMQLFITFLFVLLCVFSEDVQNFVRAREHVWIFYTSIGVSFFVVLLLMCFAREYPCNMIILWIFTIAESYAVGVLCSLFYPEMVLTAFGLTVIICFLLIMFACQTKFDFTGMGPYLCIAALLLLIMGIISIFFHDRIFQIIICSIGVVLFSFYLIYDVQLMVGGEHRNYQFEPEDYVFAAISIYIDIIMIFKYILMLLVLDES